MRRRDLVHQQSPRRRRAKAYLRSPVAAMFLRLFCRSFAVRVARISRAKRVLPPSNWRAVMLQGAIHRRFERAVWQPSWSRPMRHSTVVFINAAPFWRRSSQCARRFAARRAIPARVIRYRTSAAPVPRWVRCRRVIGWRNGRRAFDDMSLRAVPVVISVTASSARCAPDAASLRAPPRP